LLIRKVIKRLDRRAAGIVHENVDGSEFPRHDPHQFVDIFRSAEIGHNRNNFRLCPRRNFLRSVDQRFFVSCT